MVSDREDTNTLGTKPCFVGTLVTLGSGRG